MTVRVAVAGAAGRMGRQIIAAVCARPKTTLAAALESPGHPKIGEMLPDCDVKIGDDFAAIAESVDVVIDFSTPAATIALAQQCRRYKIAMVIGTTGFNETEKAALDDAAADIAMVIAPNMSAGVNIMFALAKAAVPYLRGFDTEIFEAHHRDKKDAPSGTALYLGAIVAAANGKKLEDVAVFNRHEHSAARKEYEIGFSVMRGGDNVGEHRVVFIGDGEQLEITHRATNRDIFAKGAVVAAEFVATSAAGEYDMHDVLTQNNRS